MKLCGEKHGLFLTVFFAFLLGFAPEFTGRGCALSTSRRWVVYAYYVIPHYDFVVLNSSKHKQYRQIPCNTTQHLRRHNPIENPQGNYGY